METAGGENVEFQVSEIFSTIQGEGVSAGRPVIFVRLAQCNLRCVWCDTWYTWRWRGSSAENFFHQGGEAAVADEDVEVSRMAVGEIVSRVVGVDSSRKIDTVVVSGGEPLYWNSQLHHLLSALRLAGFRRIELETNGTIKPTPDVAVRVDQYNVSPKLSSSGNALAFRQRDASYKWFVTHGAYFKYVICGEEDVTEVDALVAQYHIPKRRVFLMPEGTDEITIQQRSRLVVDLCIKRGYRYSPRLQVSIWGSRRGV